MYKSTLPVLTYYDFADHLMDNNFVPDPPIVGKVRTFYNNNKRLPSAEEMGALGLPVRE